MPRSSRRRRGQSTAEYAITLGVVVAALVGMQIYVKRAMNAKLKDGADSAFESVWTKLGRTTAPTADERQYEPYYASSDYNVKQDSNHQDVVEAGGILKKKGITEKTNRTGSQTTAAAQ